jgi:hypothetical protein
VKWNPTVRLSAMKYAIHRPKYSRSSDEMTGGMPVTIDEIASRGENAANPLIWWTLFRGSMLAWAVSEELGFEQANARDPANKFEGSMDSCQHPRKHTLQRNDHES